MEQIQTENILMQSSLKTEVILKHFGTLIQSIFPNAEKRTIFEDSSLAIQLQDTLLTSLQTSDFSMRRASATTFTSLLLWGTTPPLGETCWLCPTISPKHIHNSVELCLTFITAMAQNQHMEKNAQAEKRECHLNSITRGLVTFLFFNWAKQATTLLIENHQLLRQHPRYLNTTQAAQLRFARLTDWLHCQPPQQKLLCEVLLHANIWAGNENIPRHTVGCPPPMKAAQYQSRTDDEINCILAAMHLKDKKARVQKETASAQQLLAELIAKHTPDLGQDDQKALIKDLTLLDITISERTSATELVPEPSG
jgi:hypothetical protein